EEYELVYRSPPDGLMARIKETLTSKAKRRKQRRRERKRHRQLRDCTWRSQLFQYITDPSPTPCGPLQAWYRPRQNVEFVSAFTEPPLASEEEHTYNTRTHPRSIAESDQDHRPPSFGEDVLGIFHATSPLFSHHRYDHGDYGSMQTG
ncbi:F-box protein, partial [Dorcoceras hygrometricum]